MTNIKIIETGDDLTQREIAKKMGISLGWVNYCISELVKKGLVKAHRFRNAKNKRAYAYILTPKGIERKIKLTRQFLKTKMTEYEEMKKEIRVLSFELEKYDSEDLFPEKPTES